jgi:hypothetical protein
LGFENIFWVVILNEIVVQGSHTKKVCCKKCLWKKYKHFLLVINRVVILANIVSMGGGLCATPLYLLNNYDIITTNTRF